MLDYVRQSLGRFYGRFRRNRSDLQPKLAWPESRKPGYEYLSGNGIEIGALHQPALVPSRCRVSYVDAMTKEEGAKLFAELDPSTLVEVSQVVNLDTEGLAPFKTGSLDFVILNHVIEHVANPMKVVGELFRVLKEGGIAVISAPDKRFCFDRDRELTSFDHLFSEFQQGVTSVTDEHYLDFLKAVHPEHFNQPKEIVQEYVEKVKARREHAHVWNSDTFENFLVETLKRLKIQAKPLYETDGDQNGFEYFGVWQKTYRTIC